jgi:ABC-2 type transport system ATP-binding protein
MIRLEQLTKKYGAFTAVDALDLEVPAGQLFGFLGPNGAGKTTTLRMIAGILRPTAGRVRIGGIDVVQQPDEAKARLGFIPDRPFIYEKLTGMEFLQFVAGLFGQQGAQVEHRGRELLGLFDLEDWRDELVESYSHGMRQKLIIPAFVPARRHRRDEPMAVDPAAARS